MREKTTKSRITGRDVLPALFFFRFTQESIHICGVVKRGRGVKNLW